MRPMELSRVIFWDRGQNHFWDRGQNQSVHYLVKFYVSMCDELQRHILCNLCLPYATAECGLIADNIRYRIAHSSVCRRLQTIITFMTSRFVTIACWKTDVSNLWTNEVEVSISAELGTLHITQWKAKPCVTSFWRLHYATCPCNILQYFTAVEMVFFGWKNVYFSYFCLKHRSWGTTLEPPSVRRFYRVLTIFVL